MFTVYSTSQSNQWNLAQHNLENKMTFCPRNYIIVHFHTNTQKLCLAPPQQLVIKVGQTHLHAMIHVADIQLPSSSSQIAPRSGSIRGSRTTQKHEAQSHAKFPWQWSGRRGEWWQSKQLKNKRAEWGGGGGGITWLYWEWRGWKGVGDTPGSTFSASCFVRCHLSVSNPVHWLRANTSGCRENWWPAGPFPTSFRIISRTHFGNQRSLMDKFEWSSQLVVELQLATGCGYFVLAGSRLVGSWTSLYFVFTTGTYYKSRPNVPL